MLHYAHEIEGLAKDGYDWLTYDKCYRLERANSPNKPCWSETNQRLYNATIRKGKVTKYHSFRNEQKGEQSRSSNSERLPETPHGYCFSFHSPQKRCSANPCRWSHKCFKCQDSAPPHPIFRCRSISYNIKTTDANSRSKTFRNDYRRPDYSNGSSFTNKF